MTNRFLISVAAAALMAGTGFANAQGAGPGRDAGSAGSTAQQSAPSSDRGGASSGTMQRDSGRDAGGASDMKATQSEKSMGAEKNQRAEDQKKGGKDMKAEGKEDRGGMKSEQKGQTTGQGTMQRDQSTTQRDQTQRDQTTTQGRDQPSRDQKAQGQQDRQQTQNSGRSRGPNHYGPGRRSREAVDPATHPDHQRDQGDPRSAGDERELLDFGRHPRTSRRELPCVAAASCIDLSGMAQLQVHPRQGADRDHRSGYLRDRGGSGILTRHFLSIGGGQQCPPLFC